jgi:tRNA-splicing ligase RtcB
MWMSMGDPLEAGIRLSLEEITDLPFVESVLALPDVHQKERMEIPSSIAVVTRDVIVPEFTSVAVNDGMGVVTTGLRAEHMSADRLLQFFSRLNSHSAAHQFDTNRYSLSPEELRRVIVEGAGGVIEKYGLDESVLSRMEWNGCIPIADGEYREIFEPVPTPLLRSRFSRSEMGLNFGGNHFLEVQVVDKLLDRTLAERWGFEVGQVVVMYHLGPGPFGATLLHHYSRRSKLPRHRVVMFFLSKLLFHYVQRGGRGSVARKWALHFRRNRWTDYPADSEEGALLRRAIAMATNFGFAYRLATVKAIQDALKETLAADVQPRLFCDIAHNGIYRENVGGQPAWVARHNACRLNPGGPTIVAGSYDVPSYLGIGGDGMKGQLHSYDHGAGNLIEEYRASGRLDPAEGSLTRFVMTRGRNSRIVLREERPLRSSEPIDRLMECLERNQVMRSVIRLRPIGNLKN